MDIFYFLYDLILSLLKFCWHSEKNVSRIGVTAKIFALAKAFANVYELIQIATLNDTNNALFQSLKFEKLSIDHYGNLQYVTY